MSARPVHRVTRMRLLVAALAVAVCVPTAVSAARVAPSDASTTSAAQAGERDLYIVVQSGAPVALYQGGVAGLAATNPEALGESKLNAGSAASRAYRDYLRTTRAGLLGTLSAALGRDVQAVDQYEFALNGFSARLTAGEADLVRATPGVSFAVKNENLETLTDAGPAWMNADDVWDGSATAGAGSKGEGIVAGIIDTGINPGHPSFAGTGPVDGYQHQNPRTRFIGLCAAEPADSPCNNKLIGMYDFLGGTGVDDNGHGSHTASTVAGNVVDATLVAPTITLPSKRISGVAPHANIISYRACQSAALPVLGTCPLNALIAAIDAAAQDTPDVINFSIGGGSVDPWQDPLGLSFFGAHAAGVFVAASAGNSGPNSQTIGRPSNSPWLLSVGASTHNRRPTGVVTATKANGGQIQVSGLSISTGIGPVGLVDAKALGNEGCDPFSAAQQAQIAGKVVICTGSLLRVARGTNVKNGGGAGMVLVSSPGYKNSAVSDGHVIPTVHVGEFDGADLRAWLNGATNPQVTLRGVELETNPALGDRMVGFSSRGPDLTSPNVIKPDVTAPGVSILAAWANDAARAGDDYGMIQGTSMSSPHAAGAGALVAAVHPGWTPDQIKSALMSTAFTVPNGGKETVAVTTEDHTTPANPHHFGGGRIDVAAAARAGFTVEESVANYLAANPAIGGSAQGLNIASLADNNCTPSCSWTRTLTSTSAVPVSYTVSTTDGNGFNLTASPSSFTLVAGGTQTITITATDSSLAVNRWEFGEVRFSAGAAAPGQHFPVAVTKGGEVGARDCAIPETLLVSDPADGPTPEQDVRELATAGLFPRLDGVDNPNIEFRLKVESLATLPPNTGWYAFFTTPDGVNRWVNMNTFDPVAGTKFEYGFITAGTGGAPGSITTSGAADAGSHDPDGTVRITIAASKIGNVETGDALSAVNAQVRALIGAAGVGLISSVDTTSSADYVLTSCGGVDPTPTPTATPTPTPTSGGGSTVTLYFQGNLDEGCTGDGRVDIDFCGGPFLSTNAELDGNDAARWATTSTTDEDFDRSLIDPNWIWELTEPTTIGGPMTVEWWGNCNVCAGDLIDASEWNIRIYADGVKKFERLRIQIPVETPGVPERLTTTVNLPNITANESIVLHVDPYWPDQQNPNVILYDSQFDCGALLDEPCDSLVRMPVGGVSATPTPTATATTPPTPTPVSCVPDNVWFLGVVNDGNQPGEPRLDFQGDMHNFEFFLSELRKTYCIPDAQASILAFTDGWTNPDTGERMSPYPEASEANVKAKIAEFGAAANAQEDSLFFFFLSTHGIQYTAAGWTGGPSECPTERLAGSLSGLDANEGDGETGDFFDCELGTALNTNFAPTTRMFVAVDCSFCGGFSDSITAASGTIPDGSVPVSAGVVGPNRIVMTGCAMTTECFGSGGPGSGQSEDGGVSYRHMRNVLEGVHTCDGWTAPAFPDVQGFDVPVQSGPTDGNCSASEWFFAAVDSAYQELDPIAIQQQFRIKYGFASIDEDILILGGDGPQPTPTPTATATPSPTPTPTPTPALGDLTVSAMSASEQKPKEGEPVVVNVTVSNTGTGSAGSSRLELRLDDGSVLGTLDVPALAAGGSANLTQGWNTRGVSGQRVITATADVAGVVAESNETNNVGRLTVEIRGNKVKNGSFEQANSSGNAPESWQGSSTGAGTTSYNQNSGSASDGSDSVSITGTGGSALLAGVPTWTSAPITVSAGELLELVVDVKSAGLSSAPQVSVAYLGAAGQVLNTVKVLTAPLTTGGAFTTLSQTLVVPANVTSLRLVLGGFSATDTRTAGTVSFDNVGLFGN